ncbi:MAG: endonuclease NucS domain-containing protein, partial [Candidatus Hodarchaeales archaeon]
MPILKKEMPNSEKDLHEIIKDELESLEEGLRLLKHEFSIRKGVVDFLCVDSGGRLVIIEVKLYEDENILFQALRYYNEIDKDRYIIAKVFSKEGVDPEEHPRIILIAERFSEDIKRLTTYIIPDVELNEYTVLLTPDNKKGICYHHVSPPKIEELTFSQPELIDHIDYITKEELKPVFQRLINEIKGIDENIGEYLTQDYVGFKY